MEPAKYIGDWPYKPIRTREPLIIVKLKILLPPNQWSEEVEFVVDTGFDGEILLAHEMFTLAGYNQYTFPEKDWIEAESVTGNTIKLIGTNSLIKLNNDEYSVLVETHEMITENIIGRAFLKNFNSVLQGKDEKISIYY